MWSLHRQLADLEEPALGPRRFPRPLHARPQPHTEPTVAARAWAELDGFHAGWDVDIGAIDVIELDEATGWRTIERFALRRRRRARITAT